jgi:RNA polymerase sigma-70 factor (ECF subfamily)
VQTALVDRARRGDHEAFSVLAGGAVDRLYAIARLILRDTDLAEDATQDTLVRAWRDLPTLRDAERFDAWLHRLIVRCCADIGRRRRRWRAELSIVSIEPAQPDRAAELADRDQLERGLRRLSDAQRTILILHFYLGLSASEAADVLDIPPGTARSRLHYAIEALRAALAAEERSSVAKVRGGRSA